MLGGETDEDAERSTGRLHDEVRAFGRARCRST